MYGDVNERKRESGSCVADVVAHVYEFSKAFLVFVEVPLVDVHFG
jgi:hypothetical protein